MEQLGSFYCRGRLAETLTITYFRPPDMIDETVHPVGYYHFTAAHPFAQFSLS